VAAVLAPVVRGTPMVALGDRAGQWSFAEARLGSLHGPIAPRYEPRGHDFAAAEGSTRFRVKVSLRPSAPGAFAPPAELWLIDEAALERLIRIFEDRPKEEAERLRVARLAGPGGRLTYLVRESRTPGLSPIGPLVSEVTGQRGYAPAAAGVNLYVPVGFELFPPTRRDALNEVFDLGRHGPVLLPEAGGVVNTPKVQDAALSEWITYEAPPRRAELERIDEAPVFDWPELRVEVPPATGGQGLGVIEGWRGEVLVGVAFDEEGKLARVHPHDPSWQAWPALEHAVMKDIVPDFPLINKSFNLSYSGADL
jgi:hypothetical protein